MGIFNNMFGNDKTPTPQATVLSMLENAKNQGRITNEQYNALLQHQNNPQEMLSVLLQNGLTSNSQIENARKQATFFGIK